MPPWLRAAALALLALFCVQAGASMRHKSVTTDEIMYVAAGHYHLRTGAFDFNLTNPPLLKLLPALPLLALDLELPAMPGDPREMELWEQWQYARAFLYQNRVDADRILLLARLPVVALGAVLGAFVFAWSRRLYGDRAALLALFLFALSPNLLAHARLATLDLGVTAFMFTTAYGVDAFVRRPRWGVLIGTGLSFAAAVLTKTTAVFLIPAIAVYLVAVVASGKPLGVWRELGWVARLPEERLRARQLRSAIAAAAVLIAVGLAGLHAGYGFRTLLVPATQARAVGKALDAAPAGLRAPAEALLSLPAPIPVPLIEVLAFQARQTARGNALYLRGERSGEGWYYHQLYALAIKTPLAVLLLVLVAAATVFRRRLEPAEWLLLASTVTVLGLFSWLKSVAVGLRYLLPAFPCLHVLASRVLAPGSWPRGGAWARAGVAGLGLLCAWTALASLRIHPHYLAYFNELIGGPDNGYLHLADSYLDWGQDLKGLAAYMREHDIPRIRLGYFGSADADYYGIDYEYLPSVGLRPRGPGQVWWYEPGARDAAPFRWTDTPVALSATLRAGLFYPDYYRPFQALVPATQIGHSILIYEAPATAPRAP